MPVASRNSSEVNPPEQRSEERARQTPSGIAQTQLETWDPFNKRPETKHLASTHAFGHLTIEGTVHDDSLRSWCAKPFQELQPPPGMREAEKEISQPNNADYVLGAQVGVVKAVYGLGNSIIGMGNMVISPPARVGNWLANCVDNPATAISDAAKLKAEANTVLVAGAKIEATVKNYAHDVKQAQSHGDYMKPVTDASGELKSFGDHLKKLTPSQRTEFVTEQLTTIGTQIASGKILCKATEFFSSMMQKMDQFKSKSDAVRTELGITEKLEHNSHAHEGEKLFAGAKNLRYGYEEINSVRCADIPLQCHKNACVAAVGEMLTEGKIDQHAFVKQLELYLNPEQRGKEMPYSLLDLCTELKKQNHLNMNWEFKTVSLKRNIGFEPLLNDLLATNQQFAVTLKVAGQDAHAVIVKGVSDAGHLVIRDPGDGKMYEMIRSEFLDKYWTGQAVARKVVQK